MHAAQLAEGVALFGTIAFDPDAAEAPEWVHLLPAGGTVTTRDGRGPYTVADLAALAAESLPAGERLVLDENHSTDLAAPEGRPAPAMGWIVALEARADGLWGLVEWTDDGRALVASKKYRAISPVLKIGAKTNRVEAFLRASLVNTPNIRGLETLHSTKESTMDLLARLRTALGLADTVSEDTLVAAVTSLHQANQAHTTSLNSIATAAGMKAGETVSSETIVGAIGKLKAAPDSATITALQAELSTVTTQLNTLKADGAKAKATTFVDAAIAEGRVGVKPLREHYITRHMANAADVEKEIAALPKLVGTSVVPAGEPSGGSSTSLNAEESQVAKQLGIKPEDFIKNRDAQTAA